MRNDPFAIDTTEEETFGEFVATFKRGEDGRLSGSIRFNGEDLAGNCSIPIRDMRPQEVFMNIAESFYAIRQLWEAQELRRSMPLREVA